MLWIHLRNCIAQVYQNSMSIDSESLKTKQQRMMVWSISFIGRETIQFLKVCCGFSITKNYVNIINRAYLLCLIIFSNINICLLDVYP